MAIIRDNAIRNNLNQINTIDFSVGTPAQIATKEASMRAILTNLSTTLWDNANFLEYSDNNLQLLQDLLSSLQTINHAGVSAEVATLLWIVNNLISHIENVKNQTDSVIDPTNTPNVYAWVPTTINLTNYFDGSLVWGWNFRLEKPWETNKQVSITTANGRVIRRTWTIWLGNNLNINWNNLEINVPPTLFAGLTTADQPLTIELEFYVSWWAGRAQAQTKSKVKFNIKQQTSVATILAEPFTVTESYENAINNRLNNFYTLNSENILREYILERINNAGWWLSDFQKNILVDHIYNDVWFLWWNPANAYSLANLQAFFPNQIADESVGWDNWYRSALRNVLINPTQFNTKTRDVFLDRLRAQRTNIWFCIRDDLINQQVNEFIQEQALNSVGNITNGLLPWLFTTFSARHNLAVRHQNRHSGGFRGWKKLTWLFKWKTRRKITDISTNNYFSFFAWSDYNISDNINVAGRSINQNIRLNMNSWNNISATINITWDEQANFEFTGANSIYELITLMLWNNQIWATTKVYLIFNIYKQFVQKMQSVFGNHDLIAWWNTYNIVSQPNLLIRENGHDVFNEENFRNLESIDDLEDYLRTLAEHFNTIMTCQNRNYINWMTRKSQNKFKIWGERVGRVLRKRRNEEFTFDTEVEWVRISYENKKFIVNYNWEEIVANNLETILSYKILEWKQIQIMKTVYKELIRKEAEDPKAQALLNRRWWIWFIVTVSGQDYVVSTQWWQLRFGMIPVWFPVWNINRNRWIITWWAYLAINENIVLSNPAIASAIIRWLRRYRRMWIRT